MAPCLSMILLAVEPLDLKVRVEVEGDALRGLGRCDGPVAVLVRGVLQRITRGSDVTGHGGINDASANWNCGEDRNRWMG